jgi:UDPglucose 6-dehydrogenase
MKIAVIGTGYVGLVAGACLAETGNDVICADIDERKIARLNGGEVPIYEPGLEPLIAGNLAAGRLTFTTDVPAAVRASEVIFIAVGTPPDEDGSADLKHVLDVARTIGEAMNGEKIVITKSTVPVGTAKLVREAIESRTKHKVHVCSNPEFLKEGAAVDDFMKPDRVVLGVDSEYAAEVLRDLYAPFVRTGRSILIMDVPSAEITKYAANSMLATRISFMNAIARLCEATGADVDSVRRGIGSDARIGPSFLFPGVGYGGSCLDGRETVLIRERGAARLVSLRALFDERTPVSTSSPGDAQPEAIWTDDLEVLSWSEECGAHWRPAQIVTRRWIEEPIVELRTKLGRRVRCTMDHPLVVSDGRGGAPTVKLAGELTTSDWLPLVFDRPGPIATLDALDLAESLEDRELPDERVVARSGTRFAGACASRRPTTAVAVGTGRISPYPSLAIEPDTRFWRVVGLYLAKGRCARHGHPVQLQWSFRPKGEEDLISEVAAYWRTHDVGVDVRRRGTTWVVSVSSPVLSTWWVDELGVGVDRCSRQLPNAIWVRSAEDQLALLSGLWQGDGSWSYVDGARGVALEWRTQSPRLADGVVRLLGMHGIGGRLRVSRTASSRRDAYRVTVAGVDQVERVLDFVKPGERDHVRARLASGKKRIAPTGYRTARNAAWVRVVGRRAEMFRGWVYSLEVPATGTFVTSFGTVVHNCFPKDVKALVKTMSDLGLDASILRAVEEVNDTQKRTLLDRLTRRLGEDLGAHTVAVWGLSFKPNTDDMREAPSIVTIEGLLERGARVVAHDPVAMEEARRHFGDRIAYAAANYDALAGASALVIHTEWLPYRNPDFKRMKAAMAEPLIFDGRNLYDPADLARMGFEYHSIGRPVARPVPAAGT